MERIRECMFCKAEVDVLTRVDFLIDADKIEGVVCSASDCQEQLHKIRDARRKAKRKAAQRTSV